MRRWILFALLLAICASAGWSFLYPQEKVEQIVTSLATRMDVEETVLASGVLEASKMISVGAQVSGQLEHLYVKLGDKVEKDDLVAEIDSMPQQNTLENAQAALENMRAQLIAKEALAKKAEAVFKRQKKMRKKDAVSEESFQAAEADYATAQADVASLTAQIKQAEIEVESAKVNLGYTKITAPISGTVVAIVTEEGQTVNANQQAPTIIKLAQLETMTIKAEISEADITRVEQGQKVRFTILGEPDHYYHASLRAIEPAPDSITEDSASSSTEEAIYYNGLFDAPNEDGKLRISMTAEVYIVLNEAKNALTIPRTALGDALGDGQYRILVKDQKTGKAQARTVKVGINDHVNVEVLEGLSDGEEVVVGSSEITDDEAAEAAASQRRRPPMRM
ncbi:MAG: efflux RND transporter periplasmic adaptor subunit [Bdellovibrionales bacterium]